MSDYGVSGSLRVGDEGTVLDDVKVLAVTVDPASIGANTTANVDVTVAAGLVASGDVLLAQPPDTLEAGLVCVACTVPAANTIRFRISNVTAAAIDGASRSWNVLLVRKK